MTKELSVRLHGLQVGVLRLVNGKMEFTYDENAQKPISLSLPLQKEPFKEKVCRAFFGGLLPENPNMRELLAKKYNINVNDDFKLLKEVTLNSPVLISVEASPILSPSSYIHTK